jgi:hypothetical protein
MRIIHAGIECIRYAVCGIDKLGESRIDIGSGLEATAAAFRYGVGEAQRLPKVVIAGEVEQLARDVLEFDEFRRFKIWGTCKWGVDSGI